MDRGCLLPILTPLSALRRRTLSTAGLTLGRSTCVVARGRSADLANE